MKKLKLSPWHKKNTKPVHIGIYEICREDDESIGTMFSYFDGSNWIGWTYPEDFKRGESPQRPNANFIIHGQDRKWRGVLK